MNQNSELTFSGIFKGREKDIRITEDKMISVFDFIKVVGGHKKPKNVWYDIEKRYKNELALFSGQFKFPGRGKTLTPVINVNGMVKLLFWLPGELAKKFRSTSAETMIRYLGGDLSLIDEIKTIDNEHNNNPNNIAQVFRQEVKSNNLFNKDQINHSNNLINHFKDRKDIFYMFSFKYLEEWYSKFGIVGEVREFYNRVLEHQKEFKDICFHVVLQCNNVYKIENEFKETSLYYINKTKIPKKNGGSHVEILKLSEIVTTESIKNEMIRVAGDRILDPPPEYSELNTKDLSLDIEKEKTKQIELQEQTKQSQEKTKQLQLELEILRLRQTQQLDQPRSSTNQVDSKKELVKKFLQLETIITTKSTDYIFLDGLYEKLEEWIHSNGQTVHIPRPVFGVILSSLDEVLIKRIAIGPRVGNVTPRKTATIYRTCR
jgi:hypothetical protein